MGKEYIPLLPILIESLEETYNKPRFGFHVSDVLICILESYFKNKDPVPLGMNQLNFFTSGKGIHASYEELFTLHPERFDEHEVWLSRSTKKIFHVDDEEGIRILYQRKSLTLTIRTYLRLYHSIKEDYRKLSLMSEIEVMQGMLRDNDEKYKAYLRKNGIDPDNDIVAHIDLYDRKNNQPYEAKTSRTAGLKEAKEFHIKQLQYYMALTGADWGGVFYQYLVNFEGKPFGEFKVNMNEAQRQQKIDELINATNIYAKALETNNPENLPYVMNDPKFNNWKCWKEEWKTKTVDGVKKKYPSGVKTPECPWYDKCLEMHEVKKEVRRSGPDAGLSPNLIAKYPPQ